MSRSTDDPTCEAGRGLAELRPALARRLASLSEHAQVAAVLAELARSEGIGELVGVLGAALDDHRRGRDALGARILVAAVGLLDGPEGAALAAALLVEARTRGLAELAHFFENPPPLFLDEVRKVQVIQARDGRPLSLGERKSLARNPGRFEVDRLLQDPSPDVVRNLLSSPKLVENDVLRISTRRPAVPAVLAEVARSKWVARYRVRLALVQNPYMEPGLAVRLAALLFEQDRRRLSADHTLHPRLREFLGRSLRRSGAGSEEDNQNENGRLDVDPGCGDAGDMQGG